jgi:hypothetical protein
MIKNNGNGFQKAMARITANNAIEAVIIEPEATQLEVNNTSVSVAPSGLTNPAAQSAQEEAAPSVVVHHSFSSQSPALQVKALPQSVAASPLKSFGASLKFPAVQSWQALLESHH